MKKIYVHAFHTENNIVIVVHIFFFATRCIFFSQFYFAPIKKNLYPQNGSAMIASISSTPSSVNSRGAREDI